MKGASVCVQAGTTTERHAREWSLANKMDFRLVEFSNLAEMRKAFFDGKCEMYTADRSAVYATRQAYAQLPQEFLIFPEAISNEPLGLAVRDTDRQFSEIVRWSFNVLVAADEYDLTSINVDDMARSDNPILKRLLGTTPGLGKMLNLDEKWAYNIIKQVGNYTEIYERNVGSKSQLRIPRFLNAQASAGGMLYALPFR
jgi:general L-amino acid transport system substrate-binding protein